MFGFVMVFFFSGNEIDGLLGFACAVYPMHLSHFFLTLFSDACIFMFILENAMATGQ